MERLIRTLWFAPVFSMLFLRTGSKAILRQEGNVILLERTLHAFENALNFYKQGYHLINLDSLLGLRVAQGILERILSDKSTTDLNSVEQYAGRISTMHATCRKLSKKALPFVRDDNLVQYEKFYKIITKPWKTISYFQKLNQSKVEYKTLKNPAFKGPTSDHCLSLLLQDSTIKGQSSCNITDHCWQFETQKDLDGYTATHQVLYFLIGLEEGCRDVINQRFHMTDPNREVHDFFLETCSNVLKSVQNKAQDSAKLENEKDLFMEQTLVCSLTGYEDFLNEKYLNTVLEWQTDIGCFGKQVSKQSKWSSRSLLFERRLDDGCLVHETGVGIALLAQYIRWILETRLH